MPHDKNGALLNVTFLKTLTPANVLDVQYSLAKSGKYGENYLFAAYVVYKGQDS